MVLKQVGDLMKKLILIITFISLCNVSLFSHGNNEQEHANFAKEKPSTVCCVLQTTAKSASTVFKALDKTLDYLLSTKGAVKTLVMMTPVIAYYCKYHDINILEAVVYKAIKFIGSVEAKYAFEKEVGEVEAYIEIVQEQPGDSLLVLLKKIGETFINKGIPFLGGLLVGGK